EEVCVTPSRPFGPFSALIEAFQDSSENFLGIATLEQHRLTEKPRNDLLLITYLETGNKVQNFGLPKGN
ncbi:hypothetical protein QMN58_31370, partial [Escherichia coli]|nr:hypothetical protein [Escherichia coli]